MARQNFIGFVISQGKMDKTIKVRVLQKVFNKKVSKDYYKKKDYLVHDQANLCREGDLVRIEATRPLSSRKFFSVAEIKRNKGQQFLKYQSESKLKVSQEENAKSLEFLNKRKLNDANINESLYSDLNKINDLKSKQELSSEELKKIADLKLKYRISSWDDSFENKELFNSDVSYLSAKISGLQLDIKIGEQLDQLLKDETTPAFNQIKEKMGITEETKKNIKKNLVRKFLKVTPKEELSALGINL